MRIWELHGVSYPGAIRTTPDGEAEIAGLVLSEKAYLLAVRDVRPAQLVALVTRDGPEAAARALVQHYADPGCLHQSGGRGLVAARGGAASVILRRSDEVPERFGGAPRN